ncbi:MAG TPA: hypothetical protein VF782_03780 [Allosphingosinicella sp.]|jgi:hypothetical protein
MPTTIFDWIARTAMLAMAGLVTLSILGAIATMTGDPGTRLAAPGDRPLIEAERAQERDSAQVPLPPEAGNAAAPQGEGRAGAAVAAAASEGQEERWLEAIAYALLALAGIGALGVLMLWNVVRELRRIGRSQP